MDNEQDVIQPDSSAGAPDPQSVNGGLPQDRPVQNVVGEFNRKMGVIEDRFSRLEQALTRLATPPPAPQGPRDGLSDEELWDLATKGDRNAFDEHQRRKAERVYAELRQKESDQTLTEQQMIALRNRYPVLTNPQHPLAQTTEQMYHLLVRRGRPATLDTLLDATKTAIADRPDLVTELHTQAPRAREAARRQSVTNTGTGASYRQDEPTERVRFSVTDEERKLAKRMNVGDPVKAKERFLQRQKDGRSTFGAVGQNIDLEAQL